MGGGREGRQRKGEKVRKGVPEGEILTLEMRELPRVCGVRNFLAIYRRRCGRRVRVRGERGVKGDAKRVIEKERERPEGRSRTNNGIVTRLWMEASMKPMVCKTPCESGDAG